MAKKSNEVHLKVNIPAGFNINITLGGKTYHVQTEHGGTKNPLLTTLIYHKGEVVYSKKTDYSDILNAEDDNDKLRATMERQHKSATEEFTKKLEENRKIEYFDAIKKLLAIRNKKQALKILNDALEEFPEDPFIMSYYGWLKAVVEKKYDEGIKICQMALEKLDPVVRHGKESLYATFYLNLGRAYLAGGQREPAIEAFNDGLKIDKSNHDLLWEFKKLGTRRKPVITFLSRSNPINKYLGIMFSRLKGK